MNKLNLRNAAKHMLRRYCDCPICKPTGMLECMAVTASDLMHETHEALEEQWQRAWLNKREAMWNQAANNFRKPH